MPSRAILLSGKLREAGVKFSCNNRCDAVDEWSGEIRRYVQCHKSGEKQRTSGMFQLPQRLHCFPSVRDTRAKAREGVEVRALFDSFGNSSNNRPLKKRHLEELRSHGVEIYEFDPLRFPWVNHVFHRDHRKIVVIDGKIAYTGGNERGRLLHQRYEAGWRVA